MKIKYYLPVLLIFALVFNACKSVDDGIVVVQERDRAEQQIEDDALLVDYFQTHYFNSEELSALTDPTLQDIVITKLEEGQSVPMGHTLLIDSLTAMTRTTFFEDVEYKFYVLRINDGGGPDIPYFTDNVQVNYSGNDMEGEVFDSSVNPVIFDLTSTIPGWSRVLTEFNTAEDFIINNDGTVTYVNPGVGVMFLPSGLAYWSTNPPNSTIGVYSNLIFKFDLYDTEPIDHDGDNVPSHLEDADGDFNISNDDTDNDNLPNYLDGDDDGDLVPTLYEDLEPDLDLLVDSNGDGDPTNDIGDGNPMNDDSDGDGIPNFLDPDDTCDNRRDDNDDGIPDCDS